MRKLLLATTATLSGFMGLATIANAQVKLNDGTTVTTQFTPGGGMGSQQPAPGNIVFHFNGRYGFYAGAYFDQGANSNSSTNVATGSVTGGEKLGNIGTGGSIRLYPGFDGVAANGLRYGAYLELRDDQKPTNVFTAGSNSTGVLNGGATTNPDVAARTRDVFYAYQDWGYIGMPETGTVRVGMMFPSNGMLLTGTMENFNDGGWHGSQSLQSLQSITWPLVNNGISLAQDSIQYLSPQLAGFDFSATYAPDAAGGNPWSGCTLGGAPGGTGSVAGTGCDRLTSTSDPNSFARRTQWLDAAVRYRGTFGPVGLAASAGYIYAGAMKHSTTVGQTTFNTYHDISEYLFGAQASYAGFLIGGHYEGGKGGWQQTLQPVGGKDLSTWISGVTYTVGAATFGAQYLYSHSANGEQATTGARTQQGPYVGAQYILAPGLLTYVGYQYAAVKETGFNLVNGSANTAPAGVSTTAFQQSAAYHTGDQTKSQIVAFGAIFSW
jgi:hypothetical protein